MSEPRRPDRVGEIQKDAQATWPDAAALVADLLGRARGDIARRQVAEARVLPLEEIVALGVRDLIRPARLAGAFGTQTRPSLRSDSLIKVSLDANTSSNGPAPPECR